MVNEGVNCMESKAFYEFVSARCEEILENDLQYQQLSKKALESEKKLREALNNNFFSEVDNMICDFTSIISHLKKTIYLQCIEDIKKINN